MKQQQRKQPLVTGKEIERCVRNRYPNGCKCLDEEDDNVIAPIRMKKPSSIPNRLKRSNDAINLGMQVELLH